MNRMLQAWVVARKGRPNEQRELIYFGESRDKAKWSIRDAIASGFDYGYIKEGFQILASFNEASFTIRRTPEKERTRKRVRLAKARGIELRALGIAH